VSEYQANSSGSGWGTTITEANLAGPIAPPPPSSVTLNYQTSITAATSNQVGPQLELVNNGSASIPLSNFTIRYWFTEDGTQPLQFFCDYAPIGCANVTGTFGTTSLGGQDHYLQVSFSSGAGSLAPGANTGVMQTRFSQTNWANMTQTNDYSFNATDTTLKANPTITVYNNGTLVYGTEP
jgi:endoglucanase